MRAGNLSIRFTGFKLRNLNERPRCSRCKKKKPVDMTNNFVVDPAFAALQEGKEIQWQEVVDPASYQMYESAVEMSLRDITQTHPVTYIDTIITRKQVQRNGRDR